MSVWVTVPSKRPPAEVEKWAQAWRLQGYKIALWRDADEGGLNFRIDTGIADDYPGYAKATNTLVQRALNLDLSAKFCVIGGDDVWPDQNKTAERIEAECESHFGGTFGVMQPIGDRWHEGRGGFKNAPVDRVAGSAWIGRDFAKRAYAGNGPLWDEYFHNFCDEELQCVAQKLGVFWQRPDLTQRHMNWARGATDQEIVDVERMPDFLKRANSEKEWNSAKRMFLERKAANFPYHEAIP